MWRPKNSGTLFKLGTSSSLEALERTFGSTLDGDDVKTLRAMTIASKDAFFDEVADVIEAAGAIKVWGEW